MKISLEIKAVTAGSFEAEDGSIGTVIVNATPQPQQATIALAPGRTHALYLADGTPTANPAIAPTRKELPIPLEPFGVRVLITNL